MALEIAGRERDDDSCRRATGNVFDIQRFSVHDGPGIRTTVFLKGCPLKCQWCHNPESLSGDRQLAFYKNRCIHCGRCARACEYGAIDMMGEDRVIRDKCVVCGACAEACPTEALKMVGEATTVEEVVQTVLRDVPFYNTSKGGMTISGGEPTFQYGFTTCLLKAMRAAEVHTAIETCGLTVWQKLDDLRPLVDLFMYDIKVIDSDKHLKFCGAKNEMILENARLLSGSGADVLFRTPLVPGLNDTEKDISELAEFILSLPGSRRLELMPFHRIGSSKYDAMGMDYALGHVPNMEDVKTHVESLRSAGVDVINRI